MTYAVELPAAGPADWVAWSADLVVRIRALGPGDVVVVSVPSVTRLHRVRPRRWLGLVPAIDEAVSPWARVRRDEDHAVAELIGNETFGGDFLFADGEEERVDALGWRRPGTDLISARVWNRWFPDDVAQTAYLPHSDAEAAAALVTRTLRDLFVVTHG